MAIILPSNSSAVAGFEVTNSLQFDSGDSAYLTRTPGSITNQKTYTLSVWVKAFSNSATKHIFSANPWYVEPITMLRSKNVLQFISDFRNASTAYIARVAAGNHSQWYHLCLAIDTTQGTVANRRKLYIDGSLITSWDY